MDNISFYRNIDLICGNQCSVKNTGPYIMEIYFFHVTLIYQVNQIIRMLSFHFHLGHISMSITEIITVFCNPYVTNICFFLCIIFAGIVQIFLYIKGKFKSDCTGERPFM